jgi:hypothetical protein
LQSSLSARLTQASVVDLRDAVSAGSAKYPSLGNPEEGINTILFQRWIFLCLACNRYYVFGWVCFLQVILEAAFSPA